MTLIGSRKTMKKAVRFLRFIKTSMLFLILSYFATCLASSSVAPVQAGDSCDVVEKNAFISGWFEWEPYQYEKTTKYSSELTGLDMELLRTISHSLGFEVSIPQISWDNHIADIKSGAKDVATGATFSHERAVFAYFSEPYRFEEDSLFTYKKSLKRLNFNDVQGFLAMLRGLNYRLGILDGALYADARLNSFINDPANSDIIIKNNDDIDNLKSLMKGEIDGFITDRLVGSEIIIKNNAGDLIEEVPLNIKTPISLMLSKKTISLELLDKINAVIVKIKQDGTYDNIVKQYLYPVLLMQTTNSSWYYYVTFIGVIAFALSGVAIAARDNMTLFGTFVLATLPSLGGSIIRDIIIDDENVGLTNSTFYVEIIVAVVLIGFSFVRILDVFNKDAKKDKLMQVFWQHFFTFTDALGQACFIVTGVSIVIIAKFSPIEIWGPLFAFIIASGGTMVRDLFTKDKNISALSGDINAEISIIWGFIFSLFLSYSSDNPNLDIISAGAFLSIFGALSTRLAAIYFNISNIKFR